MTMQFDKFSFLREQDDSLATDELSHLGPARWPLVSHPFG